MTCNLCLYVFVLVCLFHLKHFWIIKYCIVLLIVALTLPSFCNLTSSQAFPKQKLMTSSSMGCRLDLLPTLHHTLLVHPRVQLQWVSQSCCKTSGTLSLSLWTFSIMLCLQIWCSSSCLVDASQWLSVVTWTFILKQFSTLIFDSSFPCSFSPGLGNGYWGWICTP